MAIEVTQTQAEVVRDKIRSMFRPWLDDSGTGPKIYDGSHEALHTPGAKVIGWEEGPYEWAIVASVGGTLDDDHELAMIAGGGKVPVYDPIKVDGVFLEPVNGSCLALYPEE